MRKMAQCVLGTSAITAAALAYSSYQSKPLAFSDRKNHKRSAPHACTRENKLVLGCDEMVVISGNANKNLAESVAKRLNKNLADCIVGRFNDGEVKVEVLESVRGKDVYVVQPTSPPVYDNLMELLLLVSTLSHASAKRVTVVCPYFGYMQSAGMSAPQIASKVGRMMSRRSKHYDYAPSAKASVRLDEDFNVSRNTATSNLAAADVARMLEVVGVDRLITVDLQAPGQGQAEGFFTNVQVEALRAEDTLMEEVVEQLDLKELCKTSQLVVAASRSGLFTKAKNIREKLVEILDDDSIGLATVIGTPAPDKSPKRVVDVVGNVNDKVVLVVGDVIENAHSMCNAIGAVKSEGATKVFAYASHALLRRNAARRIQNSELEKLVVLDTVPVSEENREQCPKLVTVSVAPTLSKLIGELHYMPKNRN